MHLFDELLTVPRSSCSVIKHAHFVLLVHVAVFITFTVGVFVAFSSMAAETAGGCDDPIFGLSLTGKVFLAFLWGVMMNVVTPVS